MKKVVLPLILLITILSFAGCAQNSTPQNTSGTTADVQAAAELTNGSTITPKQAKERLDSEAGITIVDVREPEEYAQGHIVDAILLPLGTISADAESTLTDKDAVYFVYCRSGNRSATATAQLVKLGYTHVYDLGGIIDWPYDTEK